MKRFAFAAILVAGLAAPGYAQPVLLGPAPRTPPPPAVPGPLPTPGPPINMPGAGFYKSGGVFIPATALPYDTGYYLLGGTDGFARSTGTFTMTPSPTSGHLPYPAGETFGAYFHGSFKTGCDRFRCR